MLSGLEAEECKPPCKGVCKHRCKHPDEVQSPHAEEQFANDATICEFSPVKIGTFATISKTQCMADQGIPDLPVQPLPGVLNRRAFERISVYLGRCDICNKGRAVYRSRSDRTSICEGCSARLVREWNDPFRSPAGAGQTRR